MSDIKQRLRSGTPCNESWTELASRTNRERSEAADHIEAQERRIAEQDLTHGATLRSLEDALVRIAELERDNADALNTMLWLYRRLPLGYDRPPAVERSIKLFAEKTGIKVDGYLSERNFGAAIAGKEQG